VDFFENFGGQLEDVNLADSVAVESAVPSHNMFTANVGQMAAMQQTQQATAAVGYQSVPTANQNSRIVALNVPVAQSTGSAAVSQQIVYYNGLR